MRSCLFAAVAHRDPPRCEPRSISGLSRPRSSFRHNRRGLSFQLRCRYTSRFSHASVRRELRANHGLQSDVLRAGPRAAVTAAAGAFLARMTRMMVSWFTVPQTGVFAAHGGAFCSRQPGPGAILWSTDRVSHEPTRRIVSRIHCATKRTFAAHSTAFWHSRHQPRLTRAVARRVAAISSSSDRVAGRFRVP
jgi:hypothetical protein